MPPFFRYSKKIRSRYPEQDSAILFLSKTFVIYIKTAYRIWQYFMTDRNDKRGGAGKTEMNPLAGGEAKSAGNPPESQKPSV